MSHILAQRASRSLPTTLRTMPQMRERAAGSSVCSDAHAKAAVVICARRTAQALAGPDWDFRLRAAGSGGDGGRAGGHRRTSAQSFADVVRPREGAAAAPAALSAMAASVAAWRRALR